MTHTADGKIETTVQQLELPTACVPPLLVLLYCVYWLLNRRSKAKM
jgi:hypothetical protein